jgi:hypothetical protein
MSRSALIPRRRKPGWSRWLDRKKVTARLGSIRTQRCSWLSWRQGVEIRYSLALKRSGYLHMVRGEVAVNGIELHTGDAAAREW